jgi:putative salt-induced outer membrane protein YdiY
VCWACLILAAVGAPARGTAQQAGSYFTRLDPLGEVRPLPPVAAGSAGQPAAAKASGGVELPASQNAPAEPDVKWILPPPEEAPVAEPEPAAKLWEGSFELGLDGTEGNSRTFNFRFGFDAKRKTDRDVFSMDLDYNRKTSGSEETANRFFFEWRYEWLIEDSRWTLFVHGTDDYDEFRPYDVRVSVDAGVGRKFIDTKQPSFLGRFGAGAAREVGGPDDEYVPELNFGLDYSHKISDRQKLTATVEYMPNVTEFSDCRINSKVGWEVLLDEEPNLKLKVGVRDRYDSTPGDGKPNDVDYSTVLLWSF